MPTYVHSNAQAYLVLIERVPWVCLNLPLHPSTCVWPCTSPWPLSVAMPDSAGLARFSSIAMSLGHPTTLLTKHVTSRLPGHESDDSQPQLCFPSCPAGHSRSPSPPSLGNCMQNCPPTSAKTGSWEAGSCPTCTTASPRALGQECPYLVPMWNERRSVRNEQGPQATMLLSRGTAAYRILHQPPEMRSVLPHRAWAWVGVRFGLQGSCSHSGRAWPVAPPGFAGSCRKILG